MYQRNRNLFSLLAVLITAGLITGIGGIFLVLADQLDGSPQLLSGGAGGVESELLPSTAGPQFETLGSHTAAVLSVKAAEKAPLIVSGGYDNIAQLWERNSRQSIPLPHNSPVSALAVSEQNDLLITGSDSSNLAVWFMPSGQLSDTVQAEAGKIMSVAVDAKGKTVAVGSAQGELVLWEITAGSNLQRLVSLPSVDVPINTVAFHPTDENIVVSGNEEGLVQIWDIAQNAVTFMLDSGSEAVVSIAVSNNGQYVAGGSDDQKVRVWELETGTLLQTLVGHDSRVSDVDFSPDGRLIASSSYDETLKVWAWERGFPLCTLQGHTGVVYSAAFADSGNTLVSGGYDGTVRTWDLTAAENQACLPL